MNARARPSLVAAGSIALSILLDSAPARADKEVCLAAHATAQVFRQNHHLVEARDQLKICAAPECPSIVTDDCRKWLSEIGAEIPTVVLAARDSNGTDLVDVRVSIDGARHADKLDGLPIEANPGEHVFTFVRGATSCERRIVLAQSERQRMVSVRFGTTETPKQHEPERRASVWPWVLGGVGLAGLTSFTIFAVRGSSDERSFANTCLPRCSVDNVDSVKRSYLIADISLGVGVVALGAATVMYFVDRRSASSPETPQRTAPVTAPASSCL